MNSKFPYFLDGSLHGALRTKKCDKCYENIGELRRQNTAYVDEASNWNYLCDPCQVEADEYWDDMWADYYGSVL